MKIKTTFAALVLGTSASFAIDVTSSTASWTAVAYVGGRSDYISDQQTGDNESDLVGTAIGTSPVQTAFYYDFEPQVGNTEAQIGFRVRVDGEGQNGGQFKGAIWVGMMLDGNDSVDLFAGAIIGQNSGELGFYAPGGGLNTGPSTTTIEYKTPLGGSIATSASNYLWTPVTVGPTGNDPVTGGTNNVGASGGDTNPDYFMTWVVPFSKFTAAASSRGFTVTENSQIRFIVGTAQQGNSINQDLNGVDGQLSSTSTFVQLGAVSPVVTAAGGIVPIPEPGVLSTLAMAGVAAFWVRRRKRA